MAVRAPVWAALLSMAVVSYANAQSSSIQALYRNAPTIAPPLVDTDLLGLVRNNVFYTTPGTTIAIPAPGVNPINFGAVCDGVTDDAPAINAAIQYLRDNYVGGDGTVWGKLQITPCPKPYRILSGINLTGFSPGIGFHLDVDAYGALIQCETTGKACVDLLGSRWLTIRGLQVIAPDGAAKPNIGIQIGRIAPIEPNSADNIHLEDTAFGGYFTFAAYYNLASEAFVGSRVHFNNYATGAGVYTGVWDGSNHFAVTSAYITNTIPVDTILPFGDQTLVGSDYITGTGGSAVPMYIEGVSKLRFTAVYVNTKQDHCIELATRDGGAELLDLNLDIHCETITGGTPIANTFLLTGSKANPTIGGFGFRDPHLFATNSAISTDTGVTNPVMQNVDIAIQQFHTGTAKLFDNAAPWVVEGRIYVPSILFWSSNQPNMRGMVTIGTPANPQARFYINNALVPAPNFVQSNQANVAGGDTGGKMMGYGGTAAFTPSLKGNATISMTGNVFNDTAGDAGILQPFYGTGTAPVNGAACTIDATHIKAGNGENFSPGATVAGAVFPFALRQTVTGMTVGTAYWVDLCLTSVTAGIVAAQNVSIGVEEK